METNDLQRPRRLAATLVWPGEVMFVSQPPPPDFTGMGIGLKDGRPDLLYVDQTCVGEVVAFPRVTSHETFMGVVDRDAAMTTEVDCIINLPTNLALPEPPEPVADPLSEIDGATISIGASLIYGERQRQVEQEDYDIWHDDGHRDGELAMAAMSYLLGPQGKDQVIPGHWPWESSAWKPEPNRIDNLVKAGALIAAEIDRLSRAGAVSKYSDSIEL